MHFTSTIRAYDALDRVVISALVRDEDAQGDPAKEYFSCATTVSGTGEGDHREWLRDALIALIEAL